MRISGSWMRVRCVDLASCRFVPGPRVNGLPVIGLQCCPCPVDLALVGPRPSVVGLVQKNAPKNVLANEKDGRDWHSMSALEKACVCQHVLVGHTGCGFEKLEFVLVGLKVKVITGN